MAHINIVDLPKNDISWVKPETLVALRESPCDGMIRATAQEISDHIESKKTIDYFSDFTSTDRHDLCDIVWYLKGMKDAEKSPFTNQIDVLEKVVRALGSKLRGK